MFERVVLMKKLLSKPIQWLVLGVTLIIVVVSTMLSFNVQPNYDMTTYLPKDSQTKQGLEILDTTFGNHALVELMIGDVSLLEAYQLKQDILAVEGVLTVLWLDNQADITQPDEIDPLVLSQFYRNNQALMQVVFEEDSYDLSIESSIDAINDILIHHESALRGDVIDNIYSKEIADKEMYKIMFYIVPICLLILLVASRSWLEPVIVLVVLGVGVMINLGTNIFLPNVSFITLTIASALQLAISLDYSLFFIHRYYEFKDDGLDKIEASDKAFKKSLPVITASAATTIIGFVALFLMQYRIGLDIGLVLSKGIILSFLSVIFVLPVLMVIFDKWIEKLRHRHFLFHLGGLKKLYIKYRYVLSLILVVFLVGGLYLYQNVDYLYGNNAYEENDSVVALDQKAIDGVYGSYDSLTFLLKDSTKEQEITLISTLSQENHVLNIDALYTVVDPMTPEQLIPKEVLAVYRQGDYTRVTIYIDLLEETPEMYTFYEELSETIGGEYDEFYILGLSASITEIRETVRDDTPIVIGVSILLIMIVLYIVFKNIWMVLILIISIQSAIWLNVGLLSLSNRPVIYIGYLVVFALQLGATIDYAVLFGNRYLEARKTRDKNQALGYGLTHATIPMMTSGLVLAAAGFAEMFLSENHVVSDIGLLLGRGALLSLGVVLFILPSLIYLFDRFIYRNKKNIIDKD